MSLRCQFLIVVLAIQIACASFAHAFEQSSYFVFDIVDAEEAEPTHGRLAIPADALAKVEADTRTTVEIERSEFEIDFKQPIQANSSASSSFEFDALAETTPSTENTSFGDETLDFNTETFDFGTSNTVFGE